MRLFKLICAFIFALLTIWGAMVEAASDNHIILQLLMFILAGFGIWQLVVTVKKFYNKE